MERRIRVEPQRFHQAIVCLLIAVATPFSLAVRGAGIPVLSIPTNNVFIVTNAAYGAKGDGVTDDTAAIQSAIHDAHVANGGVVRVPSSSNAYMCGPLTMENNINLQIDAVATLRLLPYAATGGTPAYPGSDAAGRNPFVTIDTKHDVLISGGGTIDGQGAAWWAAFDGGIITSRPKCFISPSSSDKVIIQDLTLNNPP